MEDPDSFDTKFHFSTTIGKGKCIFIETKVSSVEYVHIQMDNNKIII
jgi:hypothetical protein